MPRVSPTRTPMAEQEAAERIHNFDEVPYGYTPEEAMVEAQRCLLCKRPTCIDGCPVHIDIVGFLGLTAQGDFRAAINLLAAKAVVFGQTQTTGFDISSAIVARTNSS